MIRIEQLEKRFKKLTALNKVSATFTQGQVISLIGPNGSGKTTLIKSILGLVKPDGGTIRFNDKPIEQNIEYRRHIGYMPQIGRYPDNMSIGQLFAMMKSLRGKNVRLDEELFYSFRLDAMLDKPMKGLSGGTRQKVSAALAFLFDAPVLILDEPTAGLDPLASEILKEKIATEKAKGKLILITSHILSDLEELTTDVLYLQDGNVVFYKNMQALYELTGEDKLSKAVAYFMRYGIKANNSSHPLRIAK
jgi:Cu-processing system ATP-binding protein